MAAGPSVCIEGKRLAGRVGGTACLFLVGILPFLPGCMTDYGWQTVTADNPWVAPGIQPTMVEHSYAYYMAAGRSSERFWKLPSGRRVAFNDVRRRLDKYMVESGFLDQCLLTGSGVNNTRQRMAPFRLTVVCIRPDILVLTPLEITGVQPWEVNRFNLGRDAHQRIYTEYLVNRVEFGTWVPAATNMVWVNLDTQEVQTLNASSDPTAPVEYKTRGARLIATPAKDGWQVRRVD